MGEGGRKKMRVLLLALGLCLVAHGASPDHEFNEVDPMREVDEVIPQDPMRDEPDTSEPITTKIVLGKFSDPSGPITTKIGPSNQDLNGRPVTSNLASKGGKVAQLEIQGRKYRKYKEAKEAWANWAKRGKRRGGQRSVRPKRAPKGKRRTKMAKRVKRQVRAVMHKIGDADLPLNKLAKTKRRLARKAAKRVKEARKAARKYWVAGKKAFREA